MPAASKKYKGHLICENILPMCTIVEDFLSNFLVVETTNVSFLYARDSPHVLSPPLIYPTS